MIKPVLPSQSYKIQLVRGVCIIAVVMIHCLPIGLNQVFIRPFLNFAVGTFLFLSGMLSNMERYDPWKRVKKILVPYILWTLIYTAMSYIRAPGNLPTKLIKNLFTGKAAAIMYYVFVYCELTLLLPLIDRLANSRYRIIGFIVSPVEIILLRLLPLIGVYSCPAFLNIIRGISCIGYFTFFFFGYLMGNKIIKRKYSNRILIMLIAFSLFLQMAEGYWFYKLGETNCGTAMKLSAMLTTLLYCTAAFRFIMCQTPVRSKLIKLMGDYSFGIYFSHLAIKKVVELISLPKVLTRFPINAAIILGCSLVFVILGRKLLGRYAKYLAL